MATVAELKAEAGQLKIKNYSKMKKDELISAINDEKRRLEDIELEKIRQRKVERPAGPDYSLKTEEYFSLAIDPDFPVTVVKGKGIDNMARVRNYCGRQPGKDHLTVAEARRIRKRANRGDMTVPMSLHFVGMSVNRAMGVA